MTTAVDRTRALLDTPPPATIPGQLDLEPHMTDQPTIPALAVACPSCGSVPQLCTSHSGTRTRRHNVHQARTRAYAATQQTRSTQ
ncbi:hypothetical protein OG384_14825 [Streptomyces sp. NBC_01324]|uniref:hypothetical protein n=1 Tax=Streptomyces sp. NBC_01324 TaxID=2903826 RepID=UPI002E107EF6|nr:hypothetical protein OG384_14825 [Streptomyces sp. NBC_01324]